MMSAPATRIHPAEANTSITGSHKTVGLFESEEREKECLSGFIFLCNQSTKYECFRYRVFGLPLGKRKVVEEIKPGAKLFLFDFELKRLYGVYEATSVGNLYLEPDAFGGKYPAQVKFRIFKECLPILESSLRHIIKENYKGSKFKQELSGMQVAKLISSFRPLHASQTLANKPLPGAMPPPARENQLQHIERLPVKNVPYPAEGQYNHIQPSKEPRPALSINYEERSSYIREAIRCYGAHPQPSFAKEVAPKVQEPSYSRYITLEGSAMHDEVTVSGRQYRQLALQNEALYQKSVAVAYNSDSTAKEQYIPAAMLTKPYASYHQFPHNSSNSAAPSHTTSGSHQQVPAAYLPLQKEALHQHNVAAYNPNSTFTEQYTPSVIQTQPAASHHQLPDHSSNPVTPGGAASASHQEAPAAYFPTQNEASHQDKVAAYNSYSTAMDQYAPVMQTQPYASYHQFSDHSSNHAAQSQHTTSDSQQQVPVAYPHLRTEAQHQDSVTQYNYYQMALAQCASSVMQTQVPYHYGLYQGSVDAYGSNPAAPTQYDTSVFQSQVYATYLPQGEALYQHNAALYYSNPTVPVQNASVQQPQVSTTNLSIQGEALHQVNVAAYNNPSMVGNQYAPSGGQSEVPPGHAVADGSASSVSYYPYAAADQPSR